MKTAWRKALCPFEGVGPGFPPQDGSRVIDTANGQYGTTLHSFAPSEAALTAIRCPHARSLQKRPVRCVGGRFESRRRA